LFNFLKSLATNTEYEPTPEDHKNGLAGFRVGCPTSTDSSHPVEVDTNSKAYQQGLRHGKQTFESFARRYPEQIVNGAIVDDDTTEE
jgi:hypothetical protein